MSLWRLSALWRGIYLLLCLSVTAKTLSMCAYYSKSLTGSKMNLYMTALSNIHTPPSTPTSSSPTPTHPPTHSPPPDTQTGGRHAQGQNGSGGGEWVILIQCPLYLEREGANGAFLTRLTVDQSHHTFSQGTFFFFLPIPSFIFLPALHLFFLSFLFC